MDFGHQTLQKFRNNIWGKNEIEVIKDTSRNNSNLLLRKYGVQKTKFIKQERRKR